MMRAIRPDLEFSAGAKGHSHEYLLLNAHVDSEAPVQPKCSVASVC